MREETRILIKALKLMEGGHWSSSALEDFNERGEETYCAMGAISKVAEGKTRDVGSDTRITPRAADRAADILASVIKVPGGRSESTSSNIPEWNDHGDDFRKIKRGFCRAIKKSMEPATRKRNKTV